MSRIQAHFEEVEKHIKPSTKDFGFVTDPVEGCEVECYLLTQWGGKARQSSASTCRGYGGGGGGVGINLDEYLWERIDEAILKLAGHHRYVLKEWYLNSNVDVIDDRPAAVRAFKVVYQ